MSSMARPKPPEAAQIEELFRRNFPGTSAYRYNSASIRVRIIDEGFRGKSTSERERLVSPLLETLPGEIQADITVLLLLTPDEAARSLMNLEFENPSPSLL